MTGCNGEAVPKDIYTNQCLYCDIRVKQELCWNSVFNMLTVQATCDRTSKTLM